MSQQPVFFGVMPDQFGCFAALLHFPQTKWKREKWTVEASMSAFRANKARHNRPDKLKMATSGNASLQGVRRGEGGGDTCQCFWEISGQSSLLQLERKIEEERSRKARDGMCAWIINSLELYMDDEPAAE